MSLTITQARDEILTMLKEALDASSYSSIEVRWQDVSVDMVNSAPPSGTNPDPFLQVELVHVGGRQGSLGSPAIFIRNGVLRVQIYAPRALGMSTLDEIAQIVLDAYEGQSSPGGVWYRNAHVNEMGADGIWTRSDVVIDFTYNERK